MENSNFIFWNNFYSFEIEKNELEYNFFNKVKLKEDSDNESEIVDSFYKMFRLKDINNSNILPILSLKYFGLINNEIKILRKRHNNIQRIYKNKLNKI